MDVVVGICKKHLQADIAQRSLFLAFAVSTCRLGKIRSNAVHSHLDSCRALSCCVASSSSSNNSGMVAGVVIGVVVGIIVIVALVLLTKRRGRPRSFSVRQDIFSSWGHQRGAASTDC